MLRSRGLAAWLCVATLAATHLCVSVPGQAQGGARPAVAVGALGTAGPDVGTVHVLRNALAEELSELGSVRVTPEPRARWLVNGSVTRFESVQRGGETVVECEVSLVVTQRRDGAVRVMLQGRAAAQGGGALERLQTSAMRAAVRGALRPLGRSLQAS